MVAVWFSVHYGIWSMEFLNHYLSFLSFRVARTQWAVDYGVTGVGRHVVCAKWGEQRSLGSDLLWLYF